MADRQHTTGKASERSKGVKRHAIMERHGAEKESSKGERVTRGKLPGGGWIVSSKGSKPVVVGDRVTVGRLPEILKRDVQRVGRVKGGSLIVDSGPQKDIEFSEDDFEVILDLLGGSPILGSTIKSDLDAHEMLNRGLPRAALNSLVDKLQLIESDEASEALGMSLRTLQRHKNTPALHLDVQQSGRAWKFAEILAKATRVLGSQDEAEQWLRRPAIGLEQKRPVDLLTTPAGVKLIEDYLGRLEYDVYT
jgi:putative toxin-antitoxin system antitoxin component (TIGR02293 family)